MPTPNSRALGALLLTGGLMALAQYSKTAVDRFHKCARTLCPCPYDFHCVNCGLQFCWDCLIPLTIPGQYECRSCYTEGGLDEGDLDFEDDEDGDEFADATGTR